MGGRWLFQRRDSDGGDGRGGPQAAAVFDARRATACSPPLLCSPPREGGRDVSGAAAAAGDALPWGLAAEAAAEEGDASAPEGGRILRRRVLDFPAAGGHGAAALTYEEVLVLQAPREVAVAAARPPAATHAKSQPAPFAELPGGTHALLWRQRRVRHRGDRAVVSGALARGWPASTTPAAQ